MPLHLVRATEIKSGADQTAGALAAELPSEVIRASSSARRGEDEDPGGTARARVQNDRALTAPGGGVGAGRTGSRAGVRSRGRPDRDLVECCRRGVAFHHAHLSKQEKDLLRTRSGERRCTPRRAPPPSRRGSTYRLAESSSWRTTKFRVDVSADGGASGSRRTVRRGGVVRSRLGARGGRQDRDGRAAAAAFATVVSAFPRFEASCYRPGWRRRGQRGRRGPRPPVHRGGNSSDHKRRVRPADEHVRVERTVASAETHRRVEGGARALRDLGHVETRWVDKSQATRSSDDSGRAGRGMGADARRARVASQRASH